MAKKDRDSKKHFATEEWADLANSQVTGDRELAMRLHLNTGCKECADLFALWRRVGEAAQREAGYQPPDSAVRHVRRAFAILAEPEKSRQTFEQSITYFTKALEYDPNYSQAYACLGFAHIFDYQNRWTDDPDNSLPLAKQYARQALEKDPNESLARCTSAMVASFEKDLDRAKSEIDLALSLNPSLALAHSLRGSNRTYSGQPLEAIPEIELAMRLDPASSPQFLHFLGMAYLLAGKYETAAAVLRQRIVLVPRTDFSRAILASALGRLGEFEEARRVWGELKEINPNYAFAEHVGRLPFRREEDVERIAGGLREARLLNFQ